MRFIKSSLLSHSNLRKISGKKGAISVSFPVRGANVEIGRIDLTNNCSFFEVPSEHAELVLSKMKRVKVGDRKVVVDTAERSDDAPREGSRGQRKGGGEYGRFKIYKFW